MEPVVNVHWMPVGGFDNAWAVVVITMTGIINSCGESPPWKYALAPPLLLKQASVQGVAEVEVALDPHRLERGPQVGRLRGASDSDPYPAMQVSRLPARGFNLHVLADLFTEQVTVVGGEDDRLDLHDPQEPESPVADRSAPRPSGGGLA